MMHIKHSKVTLLFGEWFSVRSCLPSDLWTLLVPYISVRGSFSHILFGESFSVFLCLETYCLPWRGGRGTSCSQTYRWNIRIYWISQHYENWYQNILHSVVRLSDPERNSINKLHEISWSVSHKLLLHLISWYQVIRLCQISWRGEEYHVLRR